MNQHSTSISAASSSTEFRGGGENAKDFNEWCTANRTNPFPVKTRLRPITYLLQLARVNTFYLKTLWQYIVQLYYTVSIIICFFYIFLFFFCTFLFFFVLLRMCAYLMNVSWVHGCMELSLLFKKTFFFHCFFLEFFTHFLFYVFLFFFLIFLLQTKFQGKMTYVMQTTYDTHTHAHRQRERDTHTHTQILEFLFSKQIEYRYITQNACIIA